MQILIFGMHRTGTSMVTRLINMMGAYFGPEGSALPLKEENPKGFWERGDVLHLNDALLFDRNCTWHDLRNWSWDSDAPNAPAALQQRIRRFIAGIDGFRPWVVKDPRLCMVFSQWRPYLEAPVAVVVHRNPVEIAISLENRNQFSMEFSIALWEYYAVSLLNTTFGLPRIFVRFVDFHQRPVRTCQYLYEQLSSCGVRRLSVPSPSEIRAFVDVGLYRSKPGSSNMHSLTDTQKIIAETLRGDRRQEGLFVVSEASLQIMQTQFEAGSHDLTR